MNMFYEIDVEVSSVQSPLVVSVGGNVKERDALTAVQTAVAYLLPDVPQYAYTIQLHRNVPDALWEATVSFKIDRDVVHVPIPPEFAI